MKFYLGNRFLFIDMNHYYTHCVVEGEDRVICCQKSLEDAQEVCRNIKIEKLKRAENMEKMLERGYEDSSKSAFVFGADVKELYPTVGLLHGVIRSIRRNAESFRVVPLRSEP